VGFLQLILFKKLKEAFILGSINPFVIKETNFCYRKEVILAILFVKCLVHLVMKLLRQTHSRGPQNSGHCRHCRQVTHVVKVPNGTIKMVVGIDRWSLVQV
jgi:hypothetical protein